MNWRRALLGALATVPFVALLGWGTTRAPNAISSPLPGRAAVAAPSDPALDAQTRAVSARLRCPVCQGLSLADSPSELARALQDVVREQLSQGKTPDEVTRYFVAKYGEWILLQPEATGFNLMIYLLPLLAIVAGGALIVIVVRKWTSGVAQLLPRVHIALQLVQGVELDGHARVPQRIP